MGWTISDIESLSRMMKELGVTQIKAEGLTINRPIQTDLNEIMVRAGQKSIPQPSDDELLRNPFVGLEALTEGAKG